MDKRSFTKKAGIAADVLMYLILLVQMLYVFTGHALHEWLGLGFFLCLISLTVGFASVKVNVVFGYKGLIGA